MDSSHLCLLQQPYTVSPCSAWNGCCRTFCFSIGVSPWVIQVFKAFEYVTYASLMATAQTSEQNDEVFMLGNDPRVRPE